MQNLRIRKSWSCVHSFSYERKCFLCYKFVEDEKHFVMECFSLSAHRNTFFDELAQIVPSFFSKTEDEKFSFIMESKDYDIARVCIIHDL